MNMNDIPASAWAIAVNAKDETIAELRKKIDEQAGQIATCKEHHEFICKERDAMQAERDEALKQIAALKEIAISERYKSTVLGYASGCHWSTPDKAEETRKKARDHARQQLEAEYEAMR